MAKLTLLQLAQELTIANLVKSRSSRKSINSYLIDILVEGESKTRMELTNEITMLRIQEKEEVTAKSFEDAEFIARFAKMNKTVKNGLDTSIANGKSTSCFNSSSYSEDYILVSNADKTYSIEVVK
tara:strand:+ start:241 stop:618 length:378 start_codon:yes stop_codon:yes gene_type:complete